MQREQFGEFCSVHSTAICDTLTRYSSLKSERDLRREYKRTFFQDIVPNQRRDIVPNQRDGEVLELNPSSKLTLWIRASRYVMFHTVTGITRRITSEALQSAACCNILDSRDIKSLKWSWSWSWSLSSQFEVARFPTPL
jgi:hypothetical protein